MAVEQLSFIPESYEEKLEKRVNELEESLHKVRKALFARHGELAKLYIEQHFEFENLKSMICKGKV